MIVTRTNLYPGVALTCVNTQMFKSGCVTINFVCKLTRETASLNTLLPRVLRRGSKNLPDMAHISAALDELYGSRIEPITRKKGELYGLGFYVDFPDDCYLPNSESVLEKALEVAGELLLSPDLPDGYFREDYVESEKSNLVDDIRSAINDKRGYSVDRLLALMCEDEAFGVSKLGSEETALAITKQSLTAHYNEIITNSGVELFYCGSAEPERIETALRNVLESLPSRGLMEVPKTNVIFDPKTAAPRRFSEQLDVVQGKIVIGYRMGDAMKNPDYPAIMMFNMIFGGGVSSKLFVNVREKLSLCYYVSSMTDKHKGVMLVSSGVEFADFDKALTEIHTQLENVKNGDITEQEFNTAKRNIISLIRSALDRPGGLEELYFDSVTASIPYNPADLCEMVESVTTERVLRVASGIKQDSVFLLTGLEDTDEH